MLAFPALPAFASRLNSMKARLDLWDGEDAPLGWVRRQGAVRGLSLVDFNYPEHLAQVSVAEARAALQEAGLSAGAICLRYPKEFQLGAFTHPDQSQRQRAIKITLEACQWAEALEAPEVIVWSAYDGYDYPLQTNYQRLWGDVVAAFREVCDAFPRLKISLEPKPTEPRRYFIHNTTGAALLLVQAVERENLGITLDFGHCLMSGENPAQAAALVGSYGRLWGVQLNDGFVRPGCEDGLVLGSVHSTMTLEFLLWLQRTQYQGHLYFDTFPINEDPVREAELNIRRCTRWWEQAAQLEAAGLPAWQAQHDILSVLEHLDEL